MISVFVMDIPDKAMEAWPQIIAEAAKSPLGILALLILVLFFLALIFFRVESVVVKLGVFCLLFVLAAGVTAAALTHAAITPTVSGKPAVEGLPEIPCGKLMVSRDRGDATIDLTIWNGSTKKRYIYWLDQSGTRVAMGSLDPSEQDGWTTYHNDVWLVADQDGRCVATYRMGTEGAENINISN